MDIQILRTQRDKIESLTERIQRLRSAMEIGAQRLSLTPGSTTVRDKLADDIAKLDEMERELIAETINFESFIREAESALDKLPEQQQRVMRLRYVEGLGWRKVSLKTHYSIDHCFTINRVALKKMQKDNSK